MKLNSSVRMPRPLYITAWRGQSRQGRQDGAVAISETQLHRGSSENNKKDGDNNRD